MTRLWRGSPKISGGCWESSVKVPETIRWWVSPPPIRERAMARVADGERMPCCFDCSVSMSWETARGMDMYLGGSYIFLPLLQKENK